MTIYTHILAFFVSFMAVGLKGFQQKNIIGKHLKIAVITSYCMTITDVTFVGLVAAHGWGIAMASGTGAALGMVSAILLHDKFIGDKNVSQS